MESNLVDTELHRAVVTSPVMSFASRYNSLCASGLQDE